MMHLPSFAPAAASRILAVALGLVVVSLMPCRPDRGAHPHAVHPDLDHRAVARHQLHQGHHAHRLAEPHPIRARGHGLAGSPSVRLRSLLSNDLVVGRERATQLAQRLSAPGMVAMVATNGDMSTEGRVDAYAAPQSMAVSGGELLVAQACTRPTLGIDRAGEARIDDVRVHVTMSLAPPSQSMPGRPAARSGCRSTASTPIVMTRRSSSSPLASLPAHRPRPAGSRWSSPCQTSSDPTGCRMCRSWRCDREPAIRRWVPAWPCSPCKVPRTPGSGDSSRANGCA